MQVANYEVYFFNPPWYLDPDTRKLLDYCIRKTEQKLIEEVFAVGFSPVFSAYFPEYLNFADSLELRGI